MISEACDLAEVPGLIFKHAETKQALIRHLTCGRGNKPVVASIRKALTARKHYK